MKNKRKMSGAQSKTWLIAGHSKFWLFVQYSSHFGSKFLCVFGCLFNSHLGPNLVLGCLFNIHHISGPILFVFLVVRSIVIIFRVQFSLYFGCLFNSYHNSGPIFWVLVVCSIVFTFQVQFFFCVLVVCLIVLGLIFFVFLTLVVCSIVITFRVQVFLCFGYLFNSHHISGPFFFVFWFCLFHSHHISGPSFFVFLVICSIVHHILLDFCSFGKLLNDEFCLLKSYRFQRSGSFFCFA